MTGWRDAKTLRRLAVAVAVAAAGVTGLAPAAKAGGPSITELLIPTPASVPFGITAGPGRRPLVHRANGNRIGRITTAGVITEFTVPTADSPPFGITAGPDGALWFTEHAATGSGGSPRRG